MRQALPGLVSDITPDELAGLSCEPDVESRLVTGAGTGPWQLRHGPFDECDFSALPSADWTLLVQDVEKHLPQLAPIITAFNCLPRWRVEDLMISFAAPGGSVGPHIDSYDVFLVQVIGHRHWQIDSSPTDPQLDPESDLRVLQHFQPTQEWDLAPGDILYLPPGVAHHGVALDDCMTFSIGFRAPSRLELAVGFMRFLHNSEDTEEFYADPDLHIDECNGRQISPSAIIRGRVLLERFLSSIDDRHDEWFGTLVTENKESLTPDPLDSPYAIEDITSIIDSQRKITRHGMSLFAYSLRDSGELLFVDGHTYRVPISCAGLCAAVCDASDLRLQIKTSYVSNNDAMSLITTLINNGKLLVADS